MSDFTSICASAGTLHRRVNGEARGGGRRKDRAVAHPIPSGPQSAAVNPTSARLSRPVRKRRRHPGGYALSTADRGARFLDYQRWRRAGYSRAQAARLAGSSLPTMWREEQYYAALGWLGLQHRRPTGRSDAAKKLAQTKALLRRLLEISCLHPAIPARVAWLRLAQDPVCSRRWMEMIVELFGTPPVRP